MANRRSACKQNGRKRLLAANLQCPGQDLNLHELPRYHLKVVRLPIPPPGLIERTDYTDEVRAVESHQKLRPRHIGRGLMRVKPSPEGCTH